MTQIKAVNEYLIRIKEVVSKGNFKFIGNRRKNRNSCAKAGILFRHVKDYVLELTYLDYLNGPEPERDVRYPPGEIMFFGLNINGINFFIKLKLENDETGENCICISFHEAEKPIYYVFK